MKAKFKIFVLILMMASIKTGLFATAQKPDILILNDDEKKLYANPLQSLFFKNPELKQKFDDIGKKYVLMVSTACWRGYVAKFKIIDSSLYIVDTTIEISENPDETKNFKPKTISIFSELFETDKPVLCDSYSGMLIVPQGKMVSYVHGGYLSEYEKYILIKITDGKKINQGEYSLQDYKEKKDKAFESFCKSDKYQDSWNKIKDSFIADISEESKKEIMKTSEGFYLYDFFEF